MRIQKTKNILKKINLLVDTITDDISDLSALEEQLLKSYVVQLYDAILAKDFNYDTKLPNSPSSDEAHPTITPLSTSQSNGTGKPESNTSSTQEPNTTIERSQDARDPYQSHTTPEGIKSSADLDMINRKLDAIKKSLTNGHIGERLITDLNKSVGLNDKLHFAQTLFNGSQSDLVKAMERINAAGSEGEAKTVLLNLSETYDWNDGSKSEALDNFLQLVARKYYHN